MRFIIAGLSDRLTSLMTSYRGSCRCRSVGNLECPRLPGALSPVRLAHGCGALWRHVAQSRFFNFMSPNAARVVNASGSLPALSTSILHFTSTVMSRRFTCLWLRTRHLFHDHLTMSCRLHSLLTISRETRRCDGYHVMTHLSYHILSWDIV